MRSKGRKTMKAIKTIMSAVCISILAIALTGCGSQANSDNNKSSAQAFDANQVAEVIVHTGGQNIDIRPAAGTEVKVGAKAGKEAKISLNGDVLNIDWGDSSKIVNFKTDTLQIELPDKQYRKISLTTASGEIKGDKLKADELVVGSDSGKVEITGFEGGKVAGNVIAGDLELKDITGDFQVGNDTGSVKISHSGALMQQSRITTGTGNIELKFVDAPGSLKLDASTESGKIDSSLTGASDVSEKGAGQQLTAQIGSAGGDSPSLTIKSSSGSIYIK
ncbi:DUF4097 family beta strand repeat-containing protein [Paenibacillus fonticola]|uniref:DUF4097 family beta strand repeat-containing protein n=1 Tax=Paenibacillus fonticola TaxID=379896 RepID=UPI0003616457|nr:DUF4097 family beta strand repeat-containing protein [Paenibacillus fonticola]